MYIHQKSNARKSNGMWMNGYATRNPASKAHLPFTNLENNRLFFICQEVGSSYVVEAKD